MTKTLPPKPGCQGIIIKLSTDYTLKPREYIIVYTTVNVDCKTVRIFAYSKREQSNKTFLHCMILRKKPTVLQSTVNASHIHSVCTLLTCTNSSFGMFWILLNDRSLKQKIWIKIELPYSSISGVLVRSGWKYWTPYDLKKTKTTTTIKYVRHFRRTINLNNQ